MKKHKTSNPRPKKVTSPVLSASRLAGQAGKKEKSPPAIKVAIIGAGPIGSILGAYLLRTRYKVLFVDILKGRLETIKKTGLIISGVANFHIPVSLVSTHIREIKKFNPDYIFIAVKTSTLSSIMRPVKSAFSKNTVVICFQNGLDVEDEISDVLGKNRVLRAVVNYAGNILNEGQIIMSFFNAPNYIGAMTADSNQHAEKVARILTETGLTTKFVTDIRKFTWEKAILNAAMAPVCALTRLTMKDAMEFKGTNELIKELLKESIEVAKANGYDFGKKFFNEALEYLQKAGPHKASMLTDIESKRTTEIAFLNQKLADYGRAKNIPTPYNDTLSGLIKGMEKSFTPNNSSRTPA